MKTREGLSADKLRGGFYSPASLVAACLDRVAALTGDRADLAALEPSAGDGAFLRGLAAHPLGARVARIEAIEPDAAAAAGARAALGATGLAGRVVEASALAWNGPGGGPGDGPGDGGGYDVAVGNPPYLRYQFVGAADRQAAAALGEALGVAVAGVANLWLPVFLRAVAALKPGGAFAFILPAEVLTGVSAAALRAWLLAETRDLRLDLFPAGSFPGVLQEVVVLSGRRGTGAPEAVVAEGGTAARRAIDPAARTWTALLLTPAQAAALATARALPAVRPLGTVARFEVAIVTGANAFFSADDAALAAHGLAPWARPLLPRIRHAPGLVFDAAAHAALAAAGQPAWLLHFAADAPDPRAAPGPAAYLAAGEAAGLAGRFKCRVRAPWFRVPHVRAGALLLSKRAHFHPRVVLNAAGVLTTDTIYRGTPRAGVAAADVAAGFHNALTLLAAELEGRSFGGGVLELVPSEVARLDLPWVPGLGAGLGTLDAAARAGGEASGALRAATDAALVRADVGLDAALLATLAEAHRALQARRHARG